MGSYGGASRYPTKSAGTAFCEGGWGLRRSTKLSVVRFQTWKNRETVAETTRSSYRWAMTDALFRGLFRTIEQVAGLALGAFLTAEVAHHTVCLVRVARRG